MSIQVAGPGVTGPLLMQEGVYPRSGIDCQRKMEMVN